LGAGASLFAPAWATLTGSSGGVLALLNNVASAFLNLLPWAVVGDWCG